MNEKFVAAVKKSINTEARTVTAWASQAIIDRDDEIISAAAWAKPGALSNFKQNPALLISHDYGRLPIGKVLELEPTDRGLKFTARFGKTAAAEEAWSIVKDLGLASFSVGFIPQTWRDLTRDEVKRLGYDTSGVRSERVRIFDTLELLEVSMVSVPACPRATAVGAAYMDGRLKSPELCAALKSWKDGRKPDRQPGQPGRSSSSGEIDLAEALAFLKSQRFQNILHDEIERALARVRGKVI
jgi:HK97 family phage prohead protease